MNGLWAMIAAAEVEGETWGSGVLFVRDGQVWGGDGAFYWYGIVEVKDGGVRGSMNVHRYRAGAKPLLPVANPDFYVLTFKGGYDPAAFWAGAEILEQPELKCAVQLRKCTEAPE